MIGTSAYSDNENQRGLTFNLEHNSAYMTWAYRTNLSDKNLRMKLTYTAEKVENYDKDQIHLGCDLNLHNYGLDNALLKDWNFQGGSISGTWSGYIVTSFNSDGTAANWKSFSLTFKNGILQSATW